MTAVAPSKTVEFDLSEKKKSTSKDDYEELKGTTDDDNKFNDDLENTGDGDGGKTEKTPILEENQWGKITIVLYIPLFKCFLLNTPRLITLR